jgi:hypothetical protein
MYKGTRGPEHANLCEALSMLSLPADDYVR